MSKRVRLHEVRVELEVPFHDVDALRLVWHGHYFKYFEIARTKLLRGIGLDAGDLIGPRYRFLVTESHCRHARRLEYAERFEVAAWIREFEHRVWIDFEIMSIDHQHRCARGYTVLASVDAEGQLLLRTPAAIRERIVVPAT
jgi:acyl-CoA thioester hydrolase